MSENSKMVMSVAHSLGYGWAERHPFYEAPLSYEYADMVTEQEIYRSVEASVTPDDEDYEWILDSWEEGYWAYWDNH